MSHLLTLGSLAKEVEDIVRYIRLQKVQIKHTLVLSITKTPITEETIYTTKSSSIGQTETQMR